MQDFRHLGLGPTPILDFWNDDRPEFAFKWWKAGTPAEIPASWGGRLLVRLDLAPFERLTRDIWRPEPRNIFMYAVGDRVFVALHEAVTPFF